MTHARAITAFSAKGTPTTFSLLPVEYWFCRFVLVGSSEPQKTCWNEVEVLWICRAHRGKMFVRICVGLRPKAQRESEVHQIISSSTSWSSCLLQGKASSYLPSYNAYFLSNLSCKRPFWIACSLSSASEHGNMTLDECFYDHFSSGTTSHEHPLIQNTKLYQSKPYNWNLS